MKSKVKFAIIGAGSISFSPATVGDILLSEKFKQLDEIEIFLMDIKEKALEVSAKFCRGMAERLGRRLTIHSSLSLDDAVRDADFVITAIEVDRYHYWSMDFHIPRRYGFRQVYGENGGPGGMFHTLRNLPPMLEIARAMERLCPNAWLLNYTNPEAKLVEGISKLTSIKCVGLCHGERMGMHQLAMFLDMPVERIGAKPVGLNHFGWFTSIWDKETGEDLYPRLRENERKVSWLAHWDDYGLTRMMFRTYGLWSYPGTNHIGEYLAWSDEFLASAKIQYFFDPACEHPWETKNPPEFVYAFSGNPTERPLFPKEESFAGDPAFERNFDPATRTIKQSGEYGISIAEAIFFDCPTEIGAVNMPNKNYAKDLPEGMVIEVPALADGSGIHPHETELLPVAISAMITQQGAIHRLVLEAYTEGSKNKLLQAMLLDPTVSNYNNAVALIDEMCERQKEILPPLRWE